MNPRLRHFLTVLTAAAALSAPLSAQLVEVYHDVSSTEHENQFNTLGPQGYRMTSLSIYGTTSNLRYAAVWVQRPGLHEVAIHDATSTDYQNFFDTYCPQGYTPKIISATGPAANPRFAAVLQLTNTQCNAFHGLTASQFRAQRRTELGNGNQVIAIDIYGTQGDTRYAVAFGPKTVGQGMVQSTGSTTFQEHFDALDAGHARPSLVCFNDDDRYVSLWRSDDVGPWVAHHSMTGTEFQNHFNTYILQNRWPISLQASGSGTRIRYAAVWAPTDRPIQGNFTATGPTAPALTAFDSWAEAWMTQNEVRAASMAIVKDGRLVQARGYTLSAEPNYPVTQPTSLFEIASCTKPLTSIAIHQHFENPQTGLDPTDSMLSYFPSQSPVDNRCNNISIYHLLTHQGGWDRNATNTSIDPMVFQDENIATALGINLPIAKADIVDFMIDSQILDFTPGTDSKYSNFGYSLLGQVLEALNPNMGYAQIVRRDIFNPLGITRARIRGSLENQLAPNEVQYHRYDPWLQRSVMSDLQPWVAAQYGDLNYPNMDSHGGWTMAAPDFAKVLASFDFGAANPILGPTQTNAMWTVAPGTNRTMSGWFLRDVDDGSGGTVEMYAHNGLLLGSTAIVARRADGISFVFFANGDKRTLSDGAEAIQLSDLANNVRVWPNHDLFPRMGLPACRQYRHGGYRAFGEGCRGTSGQVLLQASGTPDVGQEMSFGITGAPAARPAFLMLGFSPTNVSLTLLGATRCTLYVNPIGKFASATDNNGDARFPWLVPGDTSTVGLRVVFQGAVLDPGANALGLTTTNGIDMALGGWF